MELPLVSDLNVSQKRVLVRADLDVDPSKDKGEIYRLEALIPTLDFLTANNAHITLIGHRGRPKGKDEKFSMKVVAQKLEGVLKEEWGEERMKGIDMQVMENLRFEEGEQKNEADYAKYLANLAEVYVNEAFATSHREHASIVGVPKYLPEHAAGVRFGEEVTNLSRVFENPKKPVLFVISGTKEGKLTYIEQLKGKADMVLVGGRLPLMMDENYTDEKVFVARLNPDKLDITVNSIERFEEEIGKAGTIVLAGVPGKYEEEGQELGTKRVFEAVAESEAFKVVGGGDSLVAIEKYGVQDKFDWISVGGGAMLEFLAAGTLPGIEALLN